MKKKYRLLKIRDFSEVLNRGKKIFSYNFSCFWIEDPLLDNIKVSIIIPKKKCKLSCDRKYLKRLFWAINNNNNIHFFPRIKCVIFYRDCFFEKFRNKKIIFSKLEEDYLILLKKIENSYKVT